MLKEIIEAFFPQQGIRANLPPTPYESTTVTTVTKAEVQQAREQACRSVGVSKAPGPYGIPNIAIDDWPKKAWNTRDSHPDQSGRAQISQLLEKTKNGPITEAW